MQQLPFVETNEDTPTQILIVNVREDVLCFRDASDLLDGLLEGILRLHGLEFGDNDQRAALSSLWAN